MNIVSSALAVGVSYNLTRAIIVHSLLSLLFLCTKTLYGHETYLAGSVRVTLQY